MLTFKAHILSFSYFGYSEKMEFSVEPKCLMSCIFTIFLSPQSDRVISTLLAPPGSSNSNIKTKVF